MKTMEKTTIYDYARMCKAHNMCANCPISSVNNGANKQCAKFISEYTNKANEIILNWCKEHPIKTRQSEFLKMFPNAKLSSDGLVSICAQGCDRSWNCKLNIDANNIGNSDCTDCMKEYWLAEVDE